jgi:hypothetical protein
MTIPPTPQPNVSNAPTQAAAPAPVWLQRLSLFILVIFCIYLGGLLTILPWWKEMWDHNPWLLAHPQLSSILHNGAAKGFVSGLGIVDIWIGVSELIQYRDYRG